MSEKKTIGMELRELSIFLKRRLSNIKSRHNASGIHLWAISYFFQNQDRDIFQRDFEKTFVLRRPTATNMLKLMEEKGFITRQNVAQDARLKKIILTDKALQIYHHVEDEITALSEQMADGLSQEEIEAFSATMQKIKKNLQ